MNKFPQPPPDRRFEKKNTYTAKRHSDVNFASDLEAVTLGENSNYNNMSLVRIKHIEEMRKSILNFKVLNDKNMFLPENTSKAIEANNVNIILFGPSGSGKSSFIKTLYRAVYGNPYLPPDALNKLIIKGTSENEGTLSFTRLFLKESSDKSSSIIVCDTRGHIWMNEDEKEQFKVILNGSIKDDVVVEQVSKRDPLRLWEFWRKDTELFPKEIFNSEKPGISSIPHSVVFVLDGSKDEVLDAEDSIFYKDLLRICLQRNYPSIHVVLTRIDILEKNILQSKSNKGLSESEKLNHINLIKDQKIEKIIELFGLKRSNIHFIENYHFDDSDNHVEIDYHALKTLCDIMNLAEQFLLNYINIHYSCFNGCFR